MLEAYANLPSLACISMSRMWAKNKLRQAVRTLDTVLCKLSVKSSWSYPEIASKELLTPA